MPCLETLPSASTIFTGVAGLPSSRSLHCGWDFIRVNESKHRQNSLLSSKSWHDLVLSLKMVCQLSFYYHTSGYALCHILCYFIHRHKCKDIRKYKSSNLRSAGFQFQKSRCCYFVLLLCKYGPLLSDHNSHLNWTPQALFSHCRRNKLSGLKSRLKSSW